MTKWIVDENLHYHNVDDITEIWVEKVYINPRSIKDHDKVQFELRFKKKHQKPDYYFCGILYLEENECEKYLENLMLGISEKKDILLLYDD